jgi:acyl-CoA synthetase (NDP forming)
LTGDQGITVKSYQGTDSLRPFFAPESVAVVGASRTPGKGGYNIIENLRRLGYPGRIYPVNPRAGEVLKIRAYPGVKNIPEPPELAIIILPPHQVIKSLEECLAAGVKAVIIESAGFGEMDAVGARRQQRMVSMARDAGMRIMGPNSVGTLNPAARFDTSLGRLNGIFLPEGDIREGTVGFIGQTGLFTGVFLPLLNDEIGISKIACLGNKGDVDESDMLEYFGADGPTKVIAMYLESIKDGRRFLGLCGRIIREKPVIVLKAAVTGDGARASATHTGAMAGEDRLYDAAFRQAGIIRVGSFEQLWDVARAFVGAPLPRGNRIGIINLAGSGCVTAVDACVKNRLKIAELSPATKASIKAVYPDWWRVRSPVDVWTAIEASGFETTYTTVTRAVLADSGVDAVVIIMGANTWLPGKDVPALFTGMKKDFPRKPVLAVTQLGDREVYLKMRRGFQAIGIPCYTSDEDAIFALAALCRYQEHLKKTI